MEVVFELEKVPNGFLGKDGVSFATKKIQHLLSVGFSLSLPLLDSNQGPSD